MCDPELNSRSDTPCMCMCKCGLHRLKLPNAVGAKKDLTPRHHTAQQKSSNVLFGKKNKHILTKTWRIIAY